MTVEAKTFSYFHIFVEIFQPGNWIESWDYTGENGASIYGKIEYVVLVSLVLEKHTHSYISSARKPYEHYRIQIDLLF